ncbi:MAG: hypothetical protein R2729_00060 [Bryobacteraceae bacterium]
MSNYLDNYGQGDAKRERVRNRILIALASVLVVGLAGYFLFRDYREKKQAAHFFELLKAKDYGAAYSLWGCDKDKPCRDYNYEKFLDDWGPKKDLAAMQVVKSQHCRNGIIQTVRFSGEEPVPLWVNRGDLQLSFAPWPVCDFRFQMPAGQ